MSKKFFLKLALLTSLILLVLAGFAEARRYKVSLKCNGGAAASIQGFLTNGGQPIPNTNFNLSCPSTSSQEFKVNGQANDVHFNYTVNTGAGIQNGQCDVNFNNPPVKIKIPGCTPGLAAAVPDSSELSVEELADVPSLTTYGFIILALLLAGTVLWLFRKRKLKMA